MPTEEIEAPFIFDYEIEALITFHLEEKLKNARDDKYQLAEDHRKRALELAEYKIRRKGE